MGNVVRLSWSCVIVVGFCCESIQVHWGTNDCDVTNELVRLVEAQGGRVFFTPPYCPGEEVQRLARKGARGGNVVKPPSSGRAALGPRGSP